SLLLASPILFAFISHPPPEPTLFPYTTLFRSDDAEERQRDDVHLRMPEEPEQVLVEQRPAVGRVVDVRADDAVGRQAQQRGGQQDRKSTRLNSSHVKISYAVFCLKKKKINNIH